jgi:uncharacterized protein YdhG (YjbR/CyaY superfamily)
MRSARKPPRNVDQYLAGFPPDVRTVLGRVRAAIGRALPRAEEVISYGIPAFRVQGRRVLYFAGWKQHYSLYPSTARLEAEFKDALAPYEVNGKGTIRFPLSAPVPAKLIADIARFRAKESAEREPPKTAAQKKR